MKRFYLSITAFVIVFCTSVCAYGANAVGAIPGNFQVSNMGAAVYNVPVECPDGVNGMKPELSFVYNSHAGDGPMGLGWNIGGLSAITRVNKQQCYDGTTSAISFTADDALVLDGMRLKKKSQSNEGVEYVTEPDSYIRIVGSDIQSWGPKYFKIYTKDGKTLTYSALQDDQLSWVLTEVCDANGNYMTYKYNTEYMLSYISQITYGKNKNGEGFESTIDFEYEYSNATTKYICGKDYAFVKRLKAVKIANNGTSWCEYTLGYNIAQITGKSRLEKITYSKGGERIKATRFDWIDSEYQILSLKKPSESSKDIWNKMECLAYGDYNGDGVTDHAYYTDGKLRIGQKMGGKEDYSEKFNDICNLTFYDVDSDGKQEIIMSRETSNGRIEHFTGKWSSGGFKWESGSKSRFPHSWTQSVSEIAGDFRGDGTIQLIPVFQQHPAISMLKSVILGKNDPAGRLANTASGDFPSLINIKETEGRYAVADVNGNGKSDFIAVDKHGNVSVYEESNGEFVKIMSASAHDPNDIFNYRGNSVIPIDDVVSEVLTGDFNGDGNADIVVVKESYVKDLLLSKSATVYISTGKDLQYTHVGNDIDLDKNTNLCIADVNGNGMSDLITYDDNKVALYISNGVHLEKVSVEKNDNIGNDLHLFAPVVAEYVTSKTGRKYYLECFDGVLSFSPVPCPDRIVWISDGLQNSIGIGYVNEAQASAAVVSEVVMRNPSGNNVQTAYAYGNILYDSKFHRYFGFSSVSGLDLESGRETVSYYKVEGSSVVLDFVEEFAGGAKIKENSCTYNAQKLTSVKERDELTGAERTVEYKDYDKYGNPLKIVTKQGKNTVTQDITYTKAGAWCDSKPSAIKTIYNYGGKTDESQHQFTYDDKGNIISDRDDVTITRYQDYDAFGNFRTIVYGEGKEQRTEKFTYTPSGRHIQSKTNAAGETTLYEWDETRGVLLSETDAYGRKTSYGYDALGRNTVTITPDGNSTEVELKWAEKGNPYNASYYTHAHTSGMGSVTTWYSSNGLELCKSQTGADGREVYVVKEYNIDGTVKRVSMPSFSKIPEAWAEQYEYDEYGRVAKVQRPEDEVTISYSGLSITIKTPSSTATKVMNAEGFLESATTNGKKVSYTYYPNGSLKTATPEGGEPVYMEYDKHGNRTLIKEADGGTVKKAYNIFGQVTESSHQQGSGSTVTTTYTYSPAGLLTQMNRGGSITDYLYDGRNRLITKTMSDGVSQSYEYDDFDRMTKVTDKVDGKEFVRSTSYDEYGRPVKNIYPSGYYTVNEYGPNGNLFSVKDQTGNELYRLVNANAMGEVTTEYRGGMSTTYEYDAMGRLTSKKSGNNRIDHTYSYDKRGNLASFTDNLSRQSCKYEYDMLNRLVKWNTYGFDSADPLKRDSLEYDELNNVIRRSNLGDNLLKYEDSNHPHALSSISGVPDAMPRMDHNITYTNFNKVESVTEGDKRYDITYGVSEQRIKSEYATASGKVTRYYIGSYEEVTGTDGVTTKLCYLPGGAVMMEKNGERTLYYNYTDRLGSIVSTTDAWGNVVEKYAYDPWGERLNPENWTEKDTRTELLNNRGFTGHEHIDGMSLINMNGRVYDPLLGSFLSVDPFIQAPYNWLNYNRYMYCYGNPLSYVDPSGNSVLLALGIGAAVGALVGLGAGLWYGYNKGYTGWDLAKCALIGTGIGACLGAVSGYFIGSSVTALMAAKTLGTFTQLGASIGSAVGLVGGAIDGLANKADGLELANYIGTGSLIGMAAGAAIGAGCYYLWSYCAAPVANANALAAEAVTSNRISASLNDFAGTFANDYINIPGHTWTEDLLTEAWILRENADMASKIAIAATRNAALAANAAKIAIRYSIAGGIAFAGGITTGAGFGYHYLSKFLFDYIPSRLYGN